jgi:hypothetical protein
MPGPLRIALVAEGKTEHEVIEAALDTILAPRRFVLTLLQPEATRPDLGTGWGGVLKWCQQLMARHDPTLDPAVESDPLLCSFYDGVVLHLDADVATFAYTDLSLSHTVASVAAKGWLPLPCVHACPPAPLPGDALHAVLLSWLHPAVPGPKTVVCMPAMNTGAWQAAAVLPAGHRLLTDLECNLGIETQLKGLAMALRVDKTKPNSRLKAAAAVKARWADVTSLCTRADAFDAAIRTAFP